MEDSHGKEIELQKTTVKIPGSIKPRIGKAFDHNRLNNEINMLNLTSGVSTVINNHSVLNKNDKIISHEEIQANQNGKYNNLLDNLNPIF